MQQYFSCCRTAQFHTMFINDRSLSTFSPSCSSYHSYTFDIPRLHPLALNCSLLAQELQTIHTFKRVSYVLLPLPHILYRHGGAAGLHIYSMPSKIGRWIGIHISCLESCQLCSCDDDGGDDEKEELKERKDSRTSLI